MDETTGARLASLVVANNCCLMLETDAGELALSLERLRLAPDAERAWRHDQARAVAAAMARRVERVLGVLDEMREPRAGEG